MPALGGAYYRCRADGSVTVADPERKTPLACVLPVKTTISFALESRADNGLLEIEASIDQRLPNKNLLYAVGVTGQFVDMSTRAVAEQVPPYRPLAEVMKTQVIFPRAAAEGRWSAFAARRSARPAAVPRGLRHRRYKNNGGYRGNHGTARIFKSMLPSANG
jgi:acetolactate decarboxylase